MRKKVHLYTSGGPWKNILQPALAPGQPLAPGHVLAPGKPLAPGQPLAPGHVLAPGQLLAAGQLLAPGHALAIQVAMPNVTTPPQAMVWRCGLLCLA